LFLHDLRRGLPLQAEPHRERIDHGPPTRPWLHSGSGGAPGGDVRIRVTETLHAHDGTIFSALPDTTLHA
jgi:hypothetical protein